MKAATPRREFVRYQPISWGPMGSVSAGRSRHRVEILNESLAGVGVRLASPATLAEGQTVTLDNGRFVRKARLVYLTRSDAGDVLAGLEWTPDSDYGFA